MIFFRSGEKSAAWEKILELGVKFVGLGANFGDYELMLETVSEVCRLGADFLV